MSLISPEALPRKIYQHFFAHITVTSSTAQALKANDEWRYNSTHSSLIHWMEVSGQIQSSADLPPNNNNSNVMLFHKMAPAIVKDPNKRR
jgi:hypothetical protein